MGFIKDTFFGGAEKKAAAARAAGIGEATEEQQRQFDLTREDFSGFRERGGLAGEEQAALAGLRGAEAEASALGRFNESPGQAFLRERQERSLLRNQAAIGGLGGGNVRTALQEQAFGIASQQLGERQSLLSQIAGRGLSATGTGAQIGAGISSNISNLQAGRGEAIAGGIEAQAAGRRSGLSRVAGAFTGGVGSKILGGAQSLFGGGRVQEIDISSLPRRRGLV